MHACIHTDRQADRQTEKYIYMYMYICICIYVYVYMCVHLYIYIASPSSLESLKHTVVDLHEPMASRHGVGHELSAAGAGQRQREPR